MEGLKLSNRILILVDEPLPYSINATFACQSADFVNVIAQQLHFNLGEIVLRLLRDLVIALNAFVIKKLW